ncbi:MAG: hypothetical protein JXA33_16635 [Anaerolineae bacterium]|nr:hypothetical protein [Anaerolineae bacterium]
MKNSDELETKIGQLLEKPTEIKDFDYTQWRQNVFAELSGEEISRQAMELQRRKQASGKTFQ